MRKEKAYSCLSGNCFMCWMNRRVFSFVDQCQFHIVAQLDGREAARKDETSELRVSQIKGLLRRIIHLRCTRRCQAMIRLRRREESCMKIRFCYQLEINLEFFLQLSRRWGPTQSLRIDLISLWTETIHSESLGAIRTDFVCCLSVCNKDCTLLQQLMSAIKAVHDIFLKTVLSISR